jgi:hypothetical protein
VRAARRWRGRGREAVELGAAPVGALGGGRDGPRVVCGASGVWERFIDGPEGRRLPPRRRRARSPRPEGGSDEVTWWSLVKSLSDLHIISCPPERFRRWYLRICCALAALVNRYMHRSFLSLSIHVSQVCLSSGRIHWLITYAGSGAEAGWVHRFGQTRCPQHALCIIQHLASLFMTMKGDLCSTGCTMSSAGMHDVIAIRKRPKASST